MTAGGKMPVSDERIHQNIRRRKAVEAAPSLNARISDYCGNRAIVVDVDDQLSFAWDSVSGRWWDFNAKERTVPGGDAEHRLAAAAASVFIQLFDAGTEDTLIRTARIWRDSESRTQAISLLRAVLDRGMEKPVHAARVSALLRGLGETDLALRATQPFADSRCEYVDATRAGALLDKYEEAPARRLLDEARRYVSRIYAISSGRSRAAQLLYRRLDAISW